MAAVELFGVQTHEQTRVVTLHAYTAQQFEVNVADLRKYESAAASHAVNSEEYKRRAIELRERLRTGRSREAMEEMRKLQAEAANRPRESTFVQKIRLYKKSSLGADYLALMPLENEEAEILIPLSQVARVVFILDPTGPDASNNVTEPADVDRQN